MENYTFNSLKKLKNKKASKYPSTYYVAFSNQHGRMAPWKVVINNIFVKEKYTVVSLEIDRVIKTKRDTYSSQKKSGLWFSFSSFLRLSFKNMFWIKYEI